METSGCRYAGKLAVTHWIPKFGLAWVPAWQSIWLENYIFNNFTVGGMYFIAYFVVVLFNNEKI